MPSLLIGARRRSGAPLVVDQAAQAGFAVPGGSADGQLSHPPSRAYYDRKRAEGKKHNAAFSLLKQPRRRVNNPHGHYN